MITEQGREFLGYLSDLIISRQTTDKLMKKLFPEKEFDSACGERNEYEFILRMVTDE